MDKRLILEIIPGPVFLLGNALGGIFLGAGLAVLATLAASILRWRWDRRLPLMALSILGLTLFLLALGLFYDDTSYVKVSNTLGSIAFALILAAGLFLRPSLLERTLGYSVHLTPQGWRTLHGVWIAVSLARAGANEAVWRSVNDNAWAIYNGIADLAWIAVFFAATWLVSAHHWKDPA